VGKRRHPVQTAVVWDTLTRALERLSADLGKPALDVVDVGGGTGRFATPAARLGHRTTVVDPSPDALATLARRAAEAGIESRVRAVQGDATALADLLGPESADVVLCHGVLEVVDDPAAAVAAVRAVLRPTGLASVLVGQRYAAVLSRAITGHIAAALEVLNSADGHWVAGDPLPRRYDEHSIGDLLAGAGLRIRELHGARTFTELVPGAVADDPAAIEALYELEAAASVDPALQAIAGQLHVLAAPAGTR
jgi:S-adenosylmethionine-dependent methyltransferase